MNDAPSILAVNQTKPVRFEVIDCQDGRVKASFRNRATANRCADRKNNSYGAHRFSVKAVWQ